MQSFFKVCFRAVPKIYVSLRKKNDKSYSMAQKSSKRFSYIGENIQKIRKVKAISQAEFATLFNLARPSVGAYEEGRSEPKVETIIEIANYFRISIDVLLTRKLTVSEIYKISTLNEKLNKAHHIEEGSSNKPKTSLPAIGLVREQEYLEYIVNRDTIDYVRRLPQIHLPQSWPGAIIRAFEMNGSEMEYHQQGLHHGDILVGEACDIDAVEGHLGCAISVVHKGDITTRRLTKVSNGSIYLSADDPNYPETEIALSDVFEIWLLKAVYSTYLNPPSLLEERVMRLEKLIQTMKKG